jgi:hypothetical protein
LVVLAGSDHFRKGAGPGTLACSLQRTDALSSSRIGATIFAITIFRDDARIHVEKNGLTAACKRDASAAISILNIAGARQEELEPIEIGDIYRRLL